MTSEEAAAQEELREWTRQQSSLIHWLREIAANLPRTTAREPAAGRPDEGPSAADEIRATLQCVLADHLSRPCGTSTMSPATGRPQAPAGEEERGMSGAAPDLALAARLATAAIANLRTWRGLRRLLRRGGATGGGPLRALDFACFESALGEAAEWPSRWSALLVARERVLDTFFLPFSPAALSCLAFSRSPSRPFPSSAARASRRRGAPSTGRSRSPAWSSVRHACPRGRDRFSSWTYSPAWVDADFPSRLSFCARSLVFFSGMMFSPVVFGVPLSAGELQSSCLGLRAEPLQDSVEGFLELR